MTIIFQEDTKGANINPTIEKLIESKWYHRIGLKDADIEAYMETFLSRLNVEDYELKWVVKDEIKDKIGRLTFRNSELWDRLKELPEQLKEKIDAEHAGTELEKLVDVLPEAVFHPAFDNAFNHFRDEKTVSFLVGNAMYIAVMICTAELAGEGELFEPILKIIEAGHIPVGVEGKVIYLL